MLYSTTGTTFRFVRRVLPPRPWSGNFWLMIVVQFQSGNKRRNSESSRNCAVLSPCGPIAHLQGANFSRRAFLTNEQISRNINLARVPRSSPITGSFTQPPSSAISPFQYTLAPCLVKNPSVRELQTITRYWHISLGSQH